MFKAAKRFCTRSLSRQLVLGIALTHALLMTIFVFDLVNRQREFLLGQNYEQAIRLAETLAANGTSWVLASDFIGMEEVIAALAKYPGLNFAAFIDMHGKVLGYTDRNQVGKYLSDELSLALMDRPMAVQVMLDNPRQIDVAVPIAVSGQQIGWARIDIDRSGIANNLELVTRNGLIYTLLAIMVGTLFAWLMARGLTRAIRNMASSAHQVGQGKRDVNFQLDRMDELGSLSQNFGSTVKILEKKELELKSYQQQLEHLVDERTLELKNANQVLTTNSVKIGQKNQKLEKAYKQLQRLQDQLIESEKLSALGALVAGVAHEINTPLGMSYTGTSYLQDQLNTLKGHFENDALTKNRLNNYLTENEKMMDAVMINMERATHIINSFKQIAVAQTTELCHEFLLNDYFKDTIYSLNNLLKQKTVVVNCDFNQEIVMMGEPGIFSQLLSNLVTNSVVHGFEASTDNQIDIQITRESDQILITYKDNGLGMNEEQLKKLYEPFYTTKMGTGGSGLGMHIVYNIVTQRLQGHINCRSQLGLGVDYKISFPFSGK